MIKTSIIKKLPSGKYRLYSRKKNPKTGKRRLLGESDTLDGIKKREKQVQFFKQHAEDQHSDDPNIKTLDDLEQTAEFLESAGYIDEAQVLWDVMSDLDQSLEDDALDQIPDNQLNIENEGNIQTSYNLYSMPGPITVAFLKQLVKTANEFDARGLVEEANELDELLEELIKEYEQNNVDMLAGVNGLVGSSATDNQNVSMFQGFSDSYMYSGYEHQEGAFDHPRQNGNQRGYNREELQTKLTL